MLNASLLSLPSSCQQGASAASSGYEVLPAAFNRATRVAGTAQALHGTWRPRWLHQEAAVPQAAPPRIIAPAAEASPVTLNWWRSILLWFTIGEARAAELEAESPEELFAGYWAPEAVVSADKGLQSAIEPDADSAASFWEEEMVSAGGALAVYSPTEFQPMSPERARIGRSFLGAYRKGRRAAEAGWHADHCPYKARLEKDGRAVNALTRTFQRYWAEGLNDGLTGAHERYV